VTKITAYEQFRLLHERPGAFVMPNAWDGGSAVLLTRAGFEALGSSSFAIAAALGRQDFSRAVSRDDAVANAALLGRLSGLPVNGDLENGYGARPDDVRHITWRWIPFAERKGLEEMTLGPTAYPMMKVKRDSSMPSKRERSEDAYGRVPQGPRDMVRTGLFEPQLPAMQAYIPRHSVLCRGHCDRTAKSSSSEPSTRWAMGRRPIQGGGRGTYVALDTSSTKGMWDRPPRREAQGDGAAIVLRGRESRPHGEGRQVS